MRVTHSSDVMLLSTGILLLCVLLGSAAESAAFGGVMRIDCVDVQTGRGVPLVQLLTPGASCPPIAPPSATIAKQAIST